MLLQGAALALTPMNVLFAIVGVAIGISVGAMPGLGPTMAIAVMVPITYQMSPETGLIMLVGVFAGSLYGGAITATMLGIPGTGADIPTMWEGYPLGQRGEAQRALSVAVISSSIGGTMSALSLILIAPLLAQFALRFGPPEFVALAVLGLGIIISLEADSFMKGLASAALGLLVAAVGIDPMTGTRRLTFGQISLYEGVPFLALLIGIFAIPEIVRLATAATDLAATRSRAAKDRVQGRLEEEATGRRTSASHLREWMRGGLEPGDGRLMAPKIVRGGFWGVLIGVLPGAGGVIATFVAYNDAKRTAKHPEQFGHGSVEGLATAEAANNGAVQSSLVPLLTLGIPGSATAAVFLGALTIHGLRPGPFVFNDTTGAIGAFLLGALFVQFWLLVLGRLGVPIFSRLMFTPRSLLVPIVVIFSVLGSYGDSNNVFAIRVMLGAGVLGIIMRHTGLSSGTFILAVILAPILEENFVRTLQLSRGDMTLFISRPLSQAIYVFALVTIVGPLIGRIRKRARSRAVSQAV
jgi:putative tricarboxylic transport membrane protein